MYASFWFSLLEEKNGRKNVAKMFGNGSWKLKFDEGEPYFICSMERECKGCINCNKKACLCSFISTRKISENRYLEELDFYKKEYPEYF